MAPIKLNIDLEDFPLSLSLVRSAATKFIVRSIIIAALERTNGNVTQAARLLFENDRSNFHRLIREHQIDVNEYRLKK